MHNPPSYLLGLRHVPYGTTTPRPAPIISFPSGFMLSMLFIAPGAHLGGARDEPQLGGG